MPPVEGLTPESHLSLSEGGWEEGERGREGGEGGEGGRRGRGGREEREGWRKEREGGREEREGGREEREGGREEREGGRREREGGRRERGREGVERGREVLCFAFQFCGDNVTCVNVYMTYIPTRTQCIFTAFLVYVFTIQVHDKYIGSSSHVCGHVMFM